jgi:uncharacterized protein YdaU (DUF1376 family)
MSREAFLPLFFGDFLASTAEWTGLEASLYLTLLGHQWAIGSLPKDVSRLYAVVKWPPRTFYVAWKQVSSKFEERDGRLYNLRLEEHRGKAQFLSEKNRLAGLKGAETRWRKDGERHRGAIAAPSERHDSANGVTHSNPYHPIPIQSGEEKKREEKTPLPPKENDDSEVYRNVQAIQAKYPETSGRVDWLGAERAMRKMVSSGEATWLELEAGVERYQRFCKATGSFVLNPAKFFQAEDRPWSQEWKLPPTKAEKRLSSNVDVLRDFIAKGTS